MEEALSRAVRAYGALRDAENDLYSLIKGRERHNGNSENVEKIDEKLYDDIRDLVIDAEDAVDCLESDESRNEELDHMWQQFVEAHGRQGVGG